MITRWNLASAGLIAGLVCALGAIPALANRLSDAQPGGSAGPVAIELFTSQGCSSCPPADALLERLATNPNVLALTRPVTYWDNLGWKDTLAREGNTNLQRAYAARGGVGAGVYTPQIMVQGTYGMVGSDEHAVRSYIAQARAHVGPAISVASQPDGSRTITIDGKAGPGDRVTVVALRSSVAVHIGRGENGGNQVRYTNVVVGEHVLANWSTNHAIVAVAAHLLHEDGADRAAVLVQQGSAGPILAARML
ncbi:DUF1223 domain-containing protein [Novosphingobium sp.]|uniref:DUF1223 domain-containing protein n=1 Tax=Novosphingobium sp. TaxID=1874826 RepID=UPI003D0C2AA5